LRSTRRPAGQRTETLAARSRPPSRITQHHTRPATRARQERQNGYRTQGCGETNTLNNKLREGMDRTCGW
jgi:hypothetical protein